MWPKVFDLNVVSIRVGLEFAQLPGQVSDVGWDPGQVRLSFDVFAAHIRPASAHPKIPPRANVTSM